MPKVPQPAKTPESISPTLWNGENREDILAFLGDLNGAYLFYQVMKGDPDPKISAIDEANAAKVDKITNLQKAQYLSQADSMYLNEKTKSPVKKAPEIGDEEAIQQAFDGASDNINFYKIPAGVYGHKDLQKGLYMLLRSMAKANYSTTIGGVSSTSPECALVPAAPRSFCQGKGQRCQRQVRLLHVVLQKQRRQVQQPHRSYLPQQEARGGWRRQCSWR